MGDFDNAIVRVAFSMVIVLGGVMLYVVFFPDQGGIGPVKTASLTAFALATTIGSFASEFGRPDARRRFYGAIGFTLGAIAVLVQVRLGIPSSWWSLMTLGTLLSASGGLSLVWDACAVRDDPDAFDERLRASISALSTVLGTFGGTFLATYLP